MSWKTYIVSLLLKTQNWPRKEPCFLLSSAFVPINILKMTALLSVSLQIKLITRNRICPPHNHVYLRYTFLFSCFVFHCTKTQSNHFTCGGISEKREIQFLY